MAERLMTQGTLDMLRAQQAQLEEQLKGTTDGSGGGHDRASWHDDAGGQHDKNAILANLARIGNLAEAELIQPRKETDIVGVGNKVNVRYVEDSEDEMIYLLGPDDAIKREDLNGRVVSILSPLGKAINGKKKNETAEIKLSPTNTSHVKILGIFEGDF